MQVLCRISNSVSDVRCKVCGQGFLVYWSRTSRAEQDVTRRNVIEALEKQHAGSDSAEVHPRVGFNVPDRHPPVAFGNVGMLRGPEWSV